MSDNTENPLSNFEESLEKLEAIVTQMEQGKLSLEQSLSAFEEGVALTRNCQESLRSAEQRVSKLIQEGDALTQEVIGKPQDS